VHRPVKTAAKLVGKLLLLLAILFGLAVTIVPRFLDRIYYRGPASDHFDGARFRNTGGEDDTARSPAGRGGRAGFFWRQLTGSDGRPRWPATVAVTPSKPVARVDGGRMVATWIGHATVLVQSNGLNILTDPVWSDHAGPFGQGPRRVAVPGVRFDDLPPIDVVLLSHNHYDHFDVATLKRLWARDRPVIVTSLGNDAILRSAGIPARALHGRREGVEALDWGGRTQVQARSFEGWRSDPLGPAPIAEVIVTRVHHWGSRWFTDRNRALWSGFVVRLPAGGGNLFFSGDTGLGDGKWPGEAAVYGPVRLAIVPIGAFRFVPGQMRSGSHIGPADAVRVVDGLQAAHALPVHWGTFRLSYEGYDTPPRMTAAMMRCAGGAPDRFAAKRIGAAWDVPPAGELSPPPLNVDRLPACERSAAVRALP
jgi:L-ascorbate metabolism protein UlaG (beta-lactamase superfamily)